MRQISLLLRTFLLLGLIAGVASAIAAVATKRRMVAGGEATPTEPTDNELDVIAIFDGVDVTSTAPALRRAAVTAWYGGGRLDLRDATLDPTGATIDAKAIFGGYQVIVPETWRVEVKGKGVFGGFGDVRDADKVEAEGPVLTVNGLAIFGGIGITSHAPELETVIEEAVSELPPIEADLVNA